MILFNQPFYNERHYIIMLAEYFNFSAAGILILLGILFVCVGIIYEATLYGLFNRVRFSLDLLPKTTILYINHRGNYQHLDSVFTTLTQ